MKKLKFCLIIALFANINSSFAQKTSPLNDEQKKELISNAEVKQILTAIYKKDFADGKFVDDGCFSFVSGDGKDKDNISMAVVSFNKNAIEIAIIKNNLTGEINVYAEDISKIYTIKKGKLTHKPSKAIKVSAKSSASCLQIYGKGLTTCVSCVTCVNNCWSKNKRWKRVSCAISNCSSACAVCVTSVWGYVNCVF